MRRRIGEGRPGISDFVRQADAAMKLAAIDVLERARRHNTPIVVWRDGKVVRLNPFTEEVVEEMETDDSSPPNNSPPPSELSLQTNAAMQDAARVVVERARRHNTPIVVWRDGKILELDPFSPEFDEPKDVESEAEEK